MGILTAISKHLHLEEAKLLQEAKKSPAKGGKKDAQPREPGTFHARINEIVFALREPVRERIDDDLVMAKLTLC